MEAAHRPPMGDDKACKRGMPALETFLYSAVTSINLMQALFHKFLHLFRPTPFIITILVLSTLPLLIMMYLTYAISEKALSRAFENNLKLIAKYKSTAIDSHIFNLQAAAEAMANNSTLVKIAKEIESFETLSLEKQEQIKKELTPLIDSFRSLINFNRIYLISDNEAILSIFDKQISIQDPPLSKHLLKTVERAKVLMETELFTMSTNEKSNSQIALMAAPITSQGNIIGALAFELSNDEIYKFIRLTDNSSPSIEVIVGTLLKDGNIFLTIPLKFDQNKRILSNSSGEEKETFDYLKKAIEGKEQQVIFTDYRGKKVIASTKYLPALRWGMIVKTDLSEAFAPIVHLRTTIIWMGASSILLLTLLAYLFSKRLQHSQNMLIQQEKLASLGILTAGVAHEINNPVNFITANINALKRDIGDLLTILERYGVATTRSDLDAITHSKKELELDVSIKEIDSLLHGIEEGALRAAAIVKDLKTISRLNEADKEAVNLHEGIDSSLILLKHTYKDKIQIVKDYGGIPLIECYAGKINQVFMNLLSNAIQSIKDKGTITIKTRQIGNHVEISIRDSGMGISNENKHKIFSPFFTTKDVGKGTGLGLSISYAIIRDHQGQMSFNSTEGAGTEFIITLPVM